MPRPSAGAAGFSGRWEFPILVAAAVFTDCLYLEEKYEHVEVLAAPELTDHWRLALLHQSLVPHGAGAEG